MPADVPAVGKVLRLPRYQFSGTVPVPGGGGFEADYGDLLESDSGAIRLVGVSNTLLPIFGNKYSHAYLYHPGSIPTLTVGSSYTDAFYARRSPAGHWGSGSGLARIPRQLIISLAPDGVSYETGGTPWTPNNGDIADGVFSSLSQYQIEVIVQKGNSFERVWTSIPYLAYSQTEFESAVPPVDTNRFVGGRVLHIGISPGDVPGHQMHVAILGETAPAGWEYRDNGVIAAIWPTTFVEDVKTNANLSSGQYTLVSNLMVARPGAPVLDDGYTVIDPDYATLFTPAERLAQFDGLDDWSVAAETINSDDEAVSFAVSQALSFFGV